MDEQASEPRRIEPGDFIELWDLPGISWKVLSVDICPFELQDGVAHPAYEIPGFDNLTRWVCDRNAKKVS